MSRHHQDMPYVIDTQEVPIVDDTDPPMHYDAFLLYSDDEVRMRTLSGGILGSAREESTGAKANGGGAIRKTRLSFELHPSVFYDDLFVDDNVDVAENINAGDVVNSLKNQNSQLEALVATLFGVDDDLLDDDNVDDTEKINAEDVVNSTKDNDAKLAALVATFYGVDLDANIRTPRAA